MGLSLHNKDNFEDILKFLKEFLNIVRGIRVSEKWKPFQAGNKTFFIVTNKFDKKKDYTINFKISLCLKFYLFINYSDYTYIK